MSEFLENLKLLEYTPVLTRIKQELNNEPIIRVSENKHEKFKQIIKDYQHNSLKQSLEDEDAIEKCINKQDAPRQSKNFKEFK